MTEGILIIGAGGHGKVIADCLLRLGHPIMGFLDDDASRLGHTIFGIRMLGASSAWRDLNPSGLVIGIGDNLARRSIAQNLDASETALPWITVVHPGAIIAPSVRLGHGTVVMAGAVINADAVIGNHAIINTGASVDHDCVIGDFVHVAPGVHLAGGIHVGEGALLGIGCSIIPGCRIGNNTIIGAGSAVVCDIPPDVTVKGVPARWK